MQKLMCIEAVFPLAGRGLLLLPEFPWGPPAAAVAAEIRRRDGVVIPVRLQVVAEHRCLTVEGLRAGTRAAARVCRIDGFDEAEVPVGSELWCDESFARDVLGGRAP